ncbi:MAG: hypothetical protein SPK50_03315 [Mobiluncus porci]|uniref:hypothetical protein n=1 Tax=Mobiluncus porci TaxID=2652278 RepID=UPI0023F2C78F|nr:hypothetical protein [Mobiluncus porci]MDD7540971.1 hypothetical protein [Mobiluncus porci]MDY5748146.1 hypothetical protein [Mobiluncus porci]
MKIKVAILVTGLLLSLSTIPANASTFSIPDTGHGSFIITNETTGKSVKIPLNVSSHTSTPTDQSGRITGHATVRISAKTLVDIGAITKQEAEHLSATRSSSGSASNTVYPVTANVGMEWTLYGSGSSQTVKISRVFGSFTKSYPTSIYNISLVARQGMNGVVLSKSPTSASFSYQTGWTPVKLVRGSWGPYALLRAKIAPDGMGSNDISVTYFPFFKLR